MYTVYSSKISAVAFSCIIQKKLPKMDRTHLHLSSISLLYPPKSDPVPRDSHKPLKDCATVPFV